MNKVLLMGHLGNDAEVRYTPSGACVASMSLATSEKWTDKDGQKQERTEWHRLKLWGDRAEKLAEYLVKGKGLLVEGKIRTEQYEKDGIKRFSTEIIVEQIHFLPDGRRSGGSAAAGGGSRGGGEQPSDDDIPF